MTLAAPGPTAKVDFADRLLAWYRRQGRRLPWRENHDPYRIWLAEIMLQQTGVTTVIPYYQRFLERFPNLFALAGASLDEVIALWAGLGYYSRARNLHAAARVLVADHGGRFPAEVEELTRLPGIGRSTAGAICAIAFGKRAPILDGNVRRILSRVYALEAPVKTADSDKRLWIWAEELTPAANVHDYTQAIMDLGATLCTPKNPSCSSCPVSPCCLAFRLGRVAEFPVPAAPKNVPTVRQITLLLEMGGNFLLRKRPYEGFLGGLWEFPNVPLRDGEESTAAARNLLRELGLEGGLHPLGTIRHAYSHFRLAAEVLRGIVFPLADKIGENSREELWFAGDAVASLPLHGAHCKIWQKFHRKGQALW
ncbi:MAG: A/G-specific adenine glycosylase [Deltaproteobacteria bacterium]|nr:A/G-specific adenine glycosylase [Deltaproteobacteria bacterium]